MLVLQYLQEIHINPLYFLSLRCLGVLVFKDVEYLQKHGNTNCPKSTVTRTVPKATNCVQLILLLVLKA